jgi:O-antigen/teichoic acid export membrane protein
LRTALTLAGVAALGVAILGLALAPWLSQVLLGTGAHAGLLRIAMLGVAGLAFQAVASGLFAGRSDLRSPLVMALAGGVVAVVVTVTLVPRGGLAGGAIGAAVLVPAGLAAAWWSRRRTVDSAEAPSPRSGFDSATGRTLLRVGLAALTLALLDQGTLLALRAHYLRVNGIPANGLLQAALALAQQVSGAFMVYLAGYAFGRISGAGDAAGIRDYTRRHWVPLVALAVAAFALAMLLASPLIALFYSDRFAPARPLMAWALFAEFCRVMTQVWGLGALPLGGLRVWMPIGIAGPAAFVPAYASLAPVAGPLALPYAAVIAAVAQLAVTGVLMSRRGVTLRAGDGVLLAVALAGLALLARTVAG